MRQRERQSGRLGLVLSWLICLIIGLAEALLLGRATMLLLAARPDNPFVVWLAALSEPLRWPLALLDVGQPRFGARLELSTLAMAVILLFIGYLLFSRARRAAEAADRDR